MYFGPAAIAFAELQYQQKFSTIRNCKELFYVQEKEGTKEWRIFPFELSFAESYFTSNLCREFLFKPSSRNFSNFRLNYADIDKFFTQNSDKIGKIVIHESHVSRKW